MAATRGRPPAVERDSLIAAALTVLDSDGIDGLTMRRLARELGVSPMAAYRHVGSKEELLRHVAASVVADLPEAPAGEPWPDVAQAFFEAFHDRLLEHPGVAGLFGGETFLSDTMYAVSEHVFAALLGAGFEPEDALSLFMACASCSIGAAILETARARGDEARGGDLVLVISAATYPSVATVAAYLPGGQSRQAHATALRNLIAGYAQSLDATWA